MVCSLFGWFGGGLAGLWLTCGWFVGGLDGFEFYS